MTHETLVKPYTTGLCHANAYWMARIAKAIYEKKEDGSPDDGKILANLQAEDARFQSVKGFNKSSAQAGLVEHANYLCMAFRGTDEIHDWLDNLNAFPTHEMFGKFHSGFYRSLEDVWAGMDGRHRELMEEKKRPLFITGHSLGGAMATVAAAKFVHRDRPFTSVYTFGQPRAMDRETARIFNMECKGRFFRFQNNNDIVTRIPARLMGYGHVGKCVYISEEKKLHGDPGFWFKFLDSVDGVVERISKEGLDCIEDHDMDDYLSAIKKWDAAADINSSNA